MNLRRKFVLSLILVVAIPHSYAYSYSFEDAKTDFATLPDSMWMNAVRFQAESSLNGTTADVLVVPVQGGESTFDPIERSLMTRLVVNELVTSAGLQVPNPTPVFQIMGAHRRQYPREDVCTLASRVSAVTILELRANYRSENEFAIEATLIDKDCTTVLRSKQWDELPFSDIRLPSASLREVLSELREFVAPGNVTNRQPKASSGLEDFKFPSSLEEMMDKSDESPIHAAANLQLIAALHPERSLDHARHGLYERSLILLEDVPAKTKGRLILEARAYAALDRRPVAVHLLQNAKTSHEKALLAALNGNLPELRRLVEEMQTSPLDLMAWRDLLEVESAYGDKQERTIVDEFVTQHTAWSAFLYRALRDTNQWGSFSDATVKVGLEMLIPNKSTSLDTVVASASVTGRMPSDLELTRLVWRHFDEIDYQNIYSRQQLPSNYSSVSALDVVDLARSLVVENHVKRIEDDLDRRRLPDAALAEINEFDSIFSGHPAVALLRGRVLWEIADDLPVAERVSQRGMAATSQLLGLKWTGQMTIDAARAARGITHLGVTYGATRPNPSREEVRVTDYAYRYLEWPRSSAWFNRIPRSEFENGIFDSCIDYKWNSFYCLQFKIDLGLDAGTMTAAEASSMLAKYDHRYQGSPQRVELEIELARAAGDDDVEIKQMREQIAAGSNDWSIYYALGRELKRRGEYQSAQDVLLSFPGFQNSSQFSAVALSQWGNDAGSMFFWIGQHELAVPLLEAGASAGSGSAGFFSAGARLSLIAGDLDAAQEWTAARVQRYQSKYAIRDLQQLLHVRGESEIAWAIFDQAKSMKANPHIWSGALVGHRMAAATTEDIVEWIATEDGLSDMKIGGSSSLHGRNKLAQRYLLLAGTMDRAPGQELAGAIAKFNFDRPTVYMKTTDIDRSGPEPIVNWRGYVRADGLSLKHDDLVPTPPIAVRHDEKVEVPSRYEMMAKGMIALANGDCEAAFEVFNDAAYYYYLDEYLPYHAYCAAQLGRADHLLPALEAREKDLAELKRKEGFDSSNLGYRFDEDLTYAVLASSEGRHDDAMTFLMKAMNNRPYIEDRSVYPYYQVVDIAELLFANTGNAVYKDYALDLARRHTVVLPMYSWAYMVVAKYAESEVESTEALASGLALDPLSHRAATLPSKRVEKAQEHLAKHAAPYLDRGPVADVGT